MGTDEFWRIKVGIGEKPNGWDLADYVLAKFDADALPQMEQGMDKAAQGVELILSRGHQRSDEPHQSEAKAAKGAERAEAGNGE